MEPTIQPRRGAPLKGEVSARDRILKAASQLFYREGIRAIGVDTVVQHSGVSKTSLYRLFDSKDALIAAFASEQDHQYWAWWDNLEDRHGDAPGVLLDALLAGIAKRIMHPDYRGCPFLNLLTEFPATDHPGRMVALRNKAEMQNRLSALFGRLGAHDPDRAASQMALVINGAYVSGQMSRSTDLTHDMRDAAMKLLR